jgi:hypothetical protein
MKVALPYFIVIFLFLYLFEPFHVNPEEQKVSYWMICVIHSLLPVCLLLVYFLIFNLIASEDYFEQWTVKREMIHFFLLFFLFGIASFLARDIIYTNPDNWSWRYFFEEIKNTFLGGSLIAFLLISLNFYRLVFLNQQHAKQLNQHIESKEPAGVESISIQTNVKADDFVLALPSFLFARAQGNYAEIFIKTSESVTKQLKRITLSQLETQLGSSPGIFRSHRAYLVNGHNIAEVKGNAQGYVLIFSETSETALVSRYKVASFDSWMSKL